MKLHNGTLARLSVPTPDYHRGAVRVGIAHVGVGNFHRAHQAVYLDRLLARDPGWGIFGIGVTPADRRMRDVLHAQDGLYTVVVEHPDGRADPRVIGSIVDYRYAPDEPAAVLDVLAAPSTRIISLTITEGGYPATPVDDPLSAFGLIVAALARRRERGVAAPTILSCDNIEHNGDVARRAVLGQAERYPGDVAGWIAERVCFPNSMVDRITPATTADVVSALHRDFGIEDRWPVVTEPFTAWLIEDEFSSGRPELADAGVLLVDDVAPHEAMKLRLLNAGHQCLAYLGYLCGYRMVHQAARDPLLAEFLREYLHSEAIPTLPPVLGVDPADYARTLLDRFANPSSRDTLARLCAYASDRIPNWLLPVIRDNVARGGPIRLAAAAVAGWARYAEGVDERGEPIEVVDALAGSLVPIARSQRTRPRAFIENTAVFADLAGADRFATAYLATLGSLHRRGARATLADLLGSE